jgi:hypothetical protein
MKMKVVDQLSMSSIRADTMPKGFVFECSAAMAKELEQKGLATRADAPEEPQGDAQPASGGAAKADDDSGQPPKGKTVEKMEQSHLNKAETPPQNKVIANAPAAKRGK